MPKEKVKRKYTRRTPVTGRFDLKTDDTMNPALKAEVQGLRGLMWGNAPIILNPRFQIARDQYTPTIHIRDAYTGLEVSVGLCDYWGAVNVLNAFFPPKP